MASKVRSSPPKAQKEAPAMENDSMPRPPSRRLDPYGRITIHPDFRHILDGPVEQRETEEGILLRPAPRPPEQKTTAG
jgi:hypothetical protein